MVAVLLAVVAAEGELRGEEEEEEEEEEGEEGEEEEAAGEEEEMDGGPRPVQDVNVTSVRRNKGSRKAEHGGRGDKEG